MGSLAGDGEECDGTGAGEGDCKETEKGDIYGPLGTTTSMCEILWRIIFVITIWNFSKCVIQKE